MKIAVIGRFLNSEAFEIVFDMLNDGVEDGKIEYEKYNVDIVKKTPEADGYIYMVTTPPKTNKKPFIHINANEEEDSMVAKVQELGAKLNAKQIIDNPVDDIRKPMDDDKSSDLCNTDSSVCNLRGLKISINGKDITLNKDDMESLRAMMELCKEYNYKIKEVICE